MKLKIALFLVLLLIPSVIGDLQPGHIPEQVDWSEAVPSEVRVEADRDGLFRGLTINNTNTGDMTYSTIKLAAGSGMAHIGKNSPDRTVNPNIMWFQNSGDEFWFLTGNNNPTRLKILNNNPGDNARSVLTLEASGNSAHIGMNSPTSSINPNLFWLMGPNDIRFVSSANPGYPILHLQGATGNIGVGIDDPSEALEVAGNILATGSICDSSGHCVSGGSGSDGLWTLIDGSDDIYRSVGNVGVGTPTPGFKLDVLGNLRLSGANNGLFRGITVENTDHGNLAFSTIMLSSGGSVAHIGKNSPTRTVNPGVMWLYNTESDPAFLLSNDNTGPGRLKLLNTHAGNSFSVFTLEATNADSSVTNAHIGKNSLSRAVNPGVMWFYNIDSDPAFLMSSDRDGVARLKLDNPNAGANGRSVLTLSANGALAHIGKNSPTSAVNPDLMWFQTNDDFGFVSGANPDPNYRILHLEGFTGNVGIGTDSPQATLDVRGDVYFEGGSGDIDGDGDVDAVDLGFIISFLSGASPTPEQFARADTDGDGLLTYNDQGNINGLANSGIPKTKSFKYGTFSNPTMTAPYFVINYPTSINKEAAPGAALDVLGNILATGSICDSSGNCIGDGLWDSVGGSDDIYRLDGNIGIGTDSPNSKLDVRGDITLGGFRALGDINIFSGDGGALPNPSSYFNPPPGSKDQGLIINVDKVHDNAEYLYTVVTDFATQAHSWNSVPPTPNGGGSEFRFLTQPRTSLSNPQVRMVIKPNGYIGIGTSTPGSVLDIKGQARIQDSIPGYFNGLVINNTNTNNAAYTTIKLETGGKAALIGKNSPDHYSSPDLFWMMGSSDIKFQSAESPGVPLMFIEGTGNVGIGTQDPDAKLDVEGNININSIDQNYPLKIENTGYGDVKIKNTNPDGYASIALENDVNSVLTMGIAGSNYGVRDSDSAYIATDGEMRFYVHDSFDPALSLREDKTVEIEEGLAFRTSAWETHSQVRHATVGESTRSLDGCGDAADPSWSNPNGVDVDPSNVAYADFDNPLQFNSRCLYSRGFGFNLPLDAQIISVEFKIRRKSQDNAILPLQVFDKTIRMILPDGTIGTEFSGINTYWDDDWYVATYGGSSARASVSPLWGFSLDELKPASVNAANFGMLFRVDRGNTLYRAGEAQISYVEATVKYRTPTGNAEYWNLEADTTNNAFKLDKLNSDATTQNIFSVIDNEPSPRDGNYEFHIGVPGGLVLDASSVARKNGGPNTWYTDSDERLKKNIKPIDNALEKLTQLQGKEYEWINPDEHSKGLQAGLIAQDVEKVFPDWVTEYYPSGEDADLIYDNGKVKSLGIGSEFYAYTVEAFRELQQENVELKQTNEQLIQAVCEINPEAKICGGDVK